MWLDDEDKELFNFASKQTDLYFCMLGLVLVNLSESFFRIFCWTAIDEHPNCGNPNLSQNATIFHWQPPWTHCAATSACGQAYIPFMTSPLAGGPPQSWIKKVLQNTVLPRVTRVVARVMLVMKSLLIHVMKPHPTWSKRHVGCLPPELQKHVRSSACTNQTPTIHFTTSYLFVQMPLLRNTIPRLKVDRTAQVLGRRRKTQQWNVTWSRAEANAGQLRYRPELAEGATEVSGFGIWGGAAKPN